MSFLFRRSTDEKQLPTTNADETNIPTQKETDLEKQLDSNTDAIDSTQKPKKLQKRPTTFLKSIIRSNGSSRNTSTSSLTSSSSKKSSISSTNNLPPLSPLNLTGYTKSTRHKLLNLELANNIRDLIPARLQLFDNWELVYSTEQHGISLNTLYRNCNLEYQLQQHKKKKKMEKGFADSVVSSMVVGSEHEKRYYYGIEPKKPIGYLLIIKDSHGAKFGAYLNENLKPMDHKRYYGNGECFLWKCERYDPTTLNHHKEDNEKNIKLTRFKAFMYTGINDNIIYSNHDFISIGSFNGQNGLYIDKSLYKGVSYRCNTFGNELLNVTNDSDMKYGEFKIMNLEIWRIGDID